ncbi:hypothetical protein GCM10008986_14580 [Salinibacillus aidingensis]|uniref:Spore protein YkvP/CgeB glycosyl transferase-like domain-containing protein n=1 Tax=Salinibacillus aidingensis TaxID=237684 RepID=A0ABP3KZ31_9BACI
MLNLLFITENTSGLLNKHYFYLEQELSKTAHVRVWRKPGHISYILNQIEQRPDFILLLNDIDRRMYPTIKGLANIDIPTGLFVNDVHRFTRLRKNYIDQNQIAYLFSVVRDPFLEIYPEYQNKMKWLPHAVHLDIFKDYELEKDIPLLMMGAVSDYYPLRQRILEVYEGQANFVYHRHPGYRHYSKKEEQQHIIGNRYARELNRAQITFTSPSVFHYPVLKYFEALACKTLLLAPTFNELEDLGFIPGSHFVSINEHNFKEKAAYFLEHETERNRIAEQGYHFIRKKHSTKLRAQQLVEIIEYILSNK